MSSEPADGILLQKGQLKSYLNTRYEPGWCAPGRQSQHPVLALWVPWLGEAHLLVCPVHTPAWLSLGIAYSEEGWSPSG